MKKFRRVVLVLAMTAIVPLSTMSAQAAPPDSNFPLCSKTITDDCMNPSQAPKAERPKAKRAKAHHSYRSGKEKAPKKGIAKDATAH